MKALHAIPADKGNRWSEYIQVKGGFVYSVNGKEFVKIPVAEVFGKGVVKEDEELYFSKHLWQASLICEATKIRREGNLFTAFSKNTVIGYLMPTGNVGENSGDLIIGSTFIKFPEFSKVIAQGKPVLRIGVGSESLNRVGIALGSKNLEISRVDNDPKFPHIVQAYGDDECTGIGYSTGLDGLIFEYVGEATETQLTTEEVISIQKEAAEELENKLEVAEKKIADLEEEKVEALKRAEEAEAITTDIQEVDLIGGKLQYKTDNLLLAEVLESFVEVMKNAENPREVMETLTMMA